MKQRYRDTKYIATSDGNIFNEKTGKYLKPQSNGNYYKVTLTICGKQIQILLHRIIAECFIPNPLNKREVNHINGDKYDNRVENLEWVTPSENQRHAVETNLKQHGTDLWNGKFTKEQVLSIIKDKQEGYSCRELGRKYGVDPTTISAISRGLRYRQYFTKDELQHALRLCGVDKTIEL